MSKTNVRGLFEKIFGSGKQPQKSYTSYKLLNTPQDTFIFTGGNAYENEQVRAAVHSFARRVATVQPRHIRRKADQFEVVANSKYSYLLQKQPNPYTTAYKFYYRLATNYKIYNNAYVYPVFDDMGKLTALYNVNAQSIQLLEYQGNLYVKMSYLNSNDYIVPYESLIHIGSMFNDNEIFGESNRRVLNPVLETAESFNRSMSKSAQLVGAIRGILKITGSPKDADLANQKKKFIRDNLSLENDGSGVVVTDSKLDYTPAQDKSTPIPSAQLEYVKNSIFNYYGTSEAIIQNKETPEQATAFYEGEIVPFYEQLTQAFTNTIFTPTEKAHGNEISFLGNAFKYIRTGEKTTALKFLDDIGALTVDQALMAYDFEPVGGELGKRRRQTLNKVNVDDVDTYQTGKPSTEEEEEKEDA